MYALLLCGRWGLLTCSLYRLGSKWFEIAFMFITQTHPKKQWDSHALRVWFMELAWWDTSPFHGHTSFCISVIYIYIHTHTHTHIDVGEGLDPVYRSTRFIEMLTPDKYLILDPMYRSTKSIEMLTPGKYLIYVNISIGLEFPMHWTQTFSLSLSLSLSLYIYIILIYLFILYLAALPVRC